MSVISRSAFGDIDIQAAYRDRMDCARMQLAIYFIMRTVKFITLAVSRMHFATAFCWLSELSRSVPAFCTVGCADACHPDSDDLIVMRSISQDVAHRYKFSDCRSFG